MKKRLIICSFTAILTLAFTSYVSALKTADTAPAVPKPAVKEEQRPASRSNFTSIIGTVSKIDAANPSSIKIEVMNERENKLETIELIPTTSVTKTTMASDIKVGDAIRVMARKVEDKEVAIGVMFSSPEKMSMPKPTASQSVPPAVKVPAAQKAITAPKK